MLLCCWLVEAITSILGAFRKHIYLSTLLLQVNLFWCSLFTDYDNTFLVH